MPQSQLGDLLAKSQWFKGRYKLKARVKGGISKAATFVARKATYATIVGLKWENQQQRERVGFLA